MSRLAPITRDTLEPAQQQVWDRIASGARGGVGGPFLPLITSAELCARVEQVGVFIRYECSVPMRLRELAILCVGEHWKAAYEWYAHAAIAAQQGIPAAVIAAIGAGAAEVPFEAEADRLVAGFVRGVLRTGQADDATYAAIVALLGEKGAVELTGLVGYYSLLAMQLNVFRIAPPPPFKAPWESA